MTASFLSPNRSSVLESFTFSLSDKIFGGCQSGTKVKAPAPPAAAASARRKQLVCRFAISELVAIYELRRAREASCNDVVVVVGCEFRVASCELDGVARF